ncbi:SDR family NAD(P)-dependent oxidoreductase [Brachybacterium sacelli]|uniref:NAD(P)-dependent dehydrogenase (Short-subunit alcohol dehydrogenase family) n=1 Tax=Brachybacterium sacelli TaxID=173364 RepID=A0ABS4X6J3_9MICO|nr:SDR family oxidoreductase [Brachybacterium sacelli]MBP2383334.1 NAD(P)-dependent dehydrogenase (short-subunit alcohol dehydrogenase family) [Brachybacterium sacelli]
MQLQHKIVIVTGGASGIGGAITRVLARRGAKVVAVDLDAEAGARLTSEFGDEVTFLEGDVARKGTADLAVRTAVERFGGLTGLVNNAHASRQAPFVDLTEDMWDLSFATGFTATRTFMLAAHPQLARSGGSIVNFGSGAALVGQPTQAAYAAAKESIRGLSRVVANEWAGDDIRVNVVCPMAMTEGVEAWSRSSPELYQASLAKVPLGRFGDPEADVAPIVAFLLSDDAAYMTGQTLMADGGANKLY